VLYGQTTGLSTALREWTPLAEQGDAVAQSYLGWMYDKGKGVTQDYKTVVKWYRLAAEKGFTLVPTYLSRIYALDFLICYREVHKCSISS
jgi:TPR repeat protein